VESFVGYSKLELILVNSKLEFIVELEFLFLSMEFQSFGSSLPKFVELKLLSGSIDSYIGSPISTIGFFWLNMIFG
jgi:hypothetical protein